MAKISTYPTIGSPSLSDILIGTDSADNNATKNFSIGDVLGLISQVYNYVPYTGATGDVDLNGYSLTVGNITLGSSNILTVPSRIILGGPLSVSNGGGVNGTILTSQGPLSQPIWKSISSLVDTITGYFYSMSNQDIAVANTPQLVLIPQMEPSVTSSTGISMPFGQKILFDASGIYSLTITANVIKSAGGASDETLDIWLKYNGSTNIIASNRKVTAQSTTHYVAFTFTQFVKVLAAGDFIEIYMSGTSTNLRLSYEAANGTHPETPSVSLVASRLRI